MKFIVSLIFTIALCSCSVNKKYDYLMDHADSIMNINDDSAAIVIKRFDSIKSELSNLSKSQRMRFELLYHKAMNKADIIFTSDSIMKEVVDYYKHHGTNNNRMLTYYVMGCVYRDLEEAPMALEYYNKAVEQADTTAKDCDYATLCRVYSQMSVIFSLQYLPQQELIALENASRYAFLAKDTVNAIINYQNRNSAYYELNNIDSAIAINLKAYKLFNRYGYKQYANIAYGSNYPYYLEKKYIQKAKQAFDIYNATAYKGNTNYGKDAEATLLCGKGLFYLQNMQLDSAIIALNKALTISESYNNKANINKALAEYYIKVNKPDIAVKHALKYSEYNDSDLVELKATQLLQAQSMYNYSRNVLIAKKAEDKAKDRMIIIYIAITIFIVIAGSGLIYHNNSIKKKTEKVRRIKNIYKEKSEELNAIQKELKSIQELNAEKLCAIITEKEEKIQEIKNELDLYEKNFAFLDIQKKEKSIRNSNVYIKFRDFELHPRKKIKKEDWDELEETIEKVIPAFATIRPKIKEKEYHICLLTKLQFSPSSISHFIGTTLSDISNSRRRILKKITGEDGTTKEFDQFIQELF